MRVTVTVPAYLEKQFEALSDDLGLSKQDTFLHCLSSVLVWQTPLPKPSGPTAHTQAAPDIYMLAAPERLKIYTFSDSGSCLRGEEIGEFHEIERGAKYSWLKFSRHSKDGQEGWENGKNGKLCEFCHPIALQLWNDGIRSF